MIEIKEIRSKQEQETRKNVIVNHVVWLPGSLLVHCGIVWF